MRRAATPEILVRGRQEFLPAAQAGVQGGDTEADRNAVPGELRMPRHRLRHEPRRVPGLTGWIAGKGGDELISAQPRRMVRAASGPGTIDRRFTGIGAVGAIPWLRMHRGVRARPGQHGADCRQHPVARNVPMPVVEALEVVHVEDGQGERVQRAACQDSIEPLRQVAAIRESGQRIGQRQPPIRLCDPLRSAQPQLQLPYVPGIETTPGAGTRLPTAPEPDGFRRRPTVLTCLGPGTTFQERDSAVE